MVPNGVPCMVLVCLLRVAAVSRGCMFRSVPSFAGRSCAGQRIIFPYPRVPLYSDSNASRHPRSDRCLGFFCARLTASRSTRSGSQAPVDTEKQSKAHSMHSVATNQHLSNTLAILYRLTT